MGKDYYKILGVDKGAGHDEIKKSFRKLAHEYHPDKPHGNEEKFKEINEAYQVLGDEKKRAQYDKYGANFEQAQRGGGFEGFNGFSGFSEGFDVNDLGDIFGGFGDIFGFGGGRGRGRKRGEDIQIILAVDFEEAVFGTEKEIRLNKKNTCSRCQGAGAEPGSKVDTCSNCNGTGRITQIQRTILGNIQSQAVCPTCSGEGKIYSNKCSKCGGLGVNKELASIKVKIPAGINEGEAIKLSGMGEAAEKNGVSGDLYLKIRINPNKNFKREGYNIISEIEIRLSQAALGTIVEVLTVDGIVKLKIPEGTESGKIFSLKEKGVPKLHGKGRGDHLVTVKVKIPKSLNRKQRQLLEELGESGV